MNPITMIIINPRKEYWPSRESNQRPPVLKSATLPTELWGSASDEQPFFLNLLPNDKVLEWHKLKAFADLKINVSQKMKFPFRREESIVVRGSQFTSIFSFSLNVFIRFLSQGPWGSLLFGTELSLLKTPWEKEKLLITSNFSFSQGVFYPFWRTFSHFHQI